MANTLTFNFESHNVRTVIINNEPWFIAKDLCDVLKIKNSRKALTALDDTEKGVTSSYTLGGNQKHAIINESGMWTLILRCRDAVIPGTIPYRVRKWVTREVLPAIRKTGAYSVNQSPEELAKNHMKSFKAFVCFDAHGQSQVSLVDVNSVVINPKDEKQVRGFIHELSDSMYPMIVDIILEHYKEVSRAYKLCRRPNDMPSGAQTLDEFVAPRVLGVANTSC